MDCKIKRQNIVATAIKFDGTLEDYAVTMQLWHFRIWAFNTLLISQAAF
ncbi:hypothetical protein [Ruminiclostridium josui]|nr:hypothetical protein [Ruminiclostridium josui]